MTFSVEYTAAGSILAFDDAPFRWIGDTGLGMAQVRNIVERGPQQHGQTRIGVRLEPRTIQAVIAIVGAGTLSKYWDDRDLLMTYLAPGVEPGKLKFTLDNGNVRQIDVHFAGGLELASADRAYLFHRIPVRFLAPDPRFYDPTAVSVAFNAGAIGTGLDVPTPVPTPIGSLYLNQALQIAYAGTWQEEPVIQIYGPVTSPKIENITTLVADGSSRSEKLDFPGITIPDGVYYEIDCRYGEKTIVDSNGVDRLSELSDDSDIATFHLATAREANNGTNAIYVSGTNYSTNTRLTMTYYTRYIGI